MVFNTRPNSYDCQWPSACKQLELHPVLAKSQDPVTRSECLIDNVNRTIEVPSRTVAVFVESRFPLPDDPPREYLEAKARAEAAETAQADAGVLTQEVGEPEPEAGVAAAEEVDKDETKERDEGPTSAPTSSALGL